MSTAAPSAEKPPAAPAAPRRKIVIIGPTPPPVHGMTTFTLMLLESPVLRAGWDVLHLDTSDRRSMENMGRLDPTNVWLALSHAARLARLVLRERPDVVFVQVAQNGWAYLRDAVFIGLARALGCRVLTHLNGGYFGEFYRTANPLVRTLVRVSSRGVDTAAVLGEGLRPIYQGLVPDERVRVLPNGVADPFAEGPPARQPAGAITVTYLGTLYAPKGYLALIDAARALPGPGFRFRFAGGWFSPQEEAEAKRRAAGDPRIEFVGVVEGDAKARLLAESDVLALPTAYPFEGQPQVILEAMAAAIPVVATPRAAIPDTVVDGTTGLLVPEGDTPALAEALRRLADDGLRARMGQAARARYLERFTAERCAARLVEIVDEMCGAAGASR